MGGAITGDGEEAEEVKDWEKASTPCEVPSNF